MLKIVAADGTVIQHSRNLRGIREYVRTHSVDRLYIYDGVTPPDSDYTHPGLYLDFDNGAVYDAEFADFAVLKDFVRRWRSVYGAPLLVNGVKRGEVSYDNPALA